MTGKEQRRGKIKHPDKHLEALLRYQVTPVDAVDEHTDAMLDVLSVEPNLIDPDIGADLHINDFRQLLYCTR